MSEPSQYPILTIAIPTYKRAAFLALNLAQLRGEIAGLEALVEVLVSDNASPDETREVVSAAASDGLALRYVRNDENIGSDANIAQCFDLALGRYVLIMGDDDLFIDGALQALVDVLRTGAHGVVCMRPYGFDTNFRREYPGSGGRSRTFGDAGEFLAAIGPLVTLISACAINKQRMPPVQAKSFCGDNLVQVHLALRAALQAETNLFIERYLIACKRNNSGGYDFSQVFVNNFMAVLDSCKPYGLRDTAIRAVEQRFMLAYYPYYLLRQRLARSGDLEATLARFKGRFTGRFLFNVWLRPIMSLPRPFAIVWGGVATLIGRSLNGDLWRGLHFLWHKCTAKRA